MPPLEEVGKKESKQLEKDRKERDARIKLQNTPWEDLNADEKLERMREVVKQGQESYNRRLNTVEGSTRKMEKHSHQDGEVVVPLSDRGFGGSCGIAESIRRMPEGKSWF